MQQLLEKLAGFKHIIWDWNGTLVNDVDQVACVVNELLQEQGLPEISLDHYRDNFHHPVIDFYTSIGFDFNTYPFDNLCQSFNQKYDEKSSTIALYNDAREVVQTIAAGDWQQSILSAAHEPLLRQSVHNYGIEEYFDNIFGLDNLHAVSKVERGHELMAASGISPSETVLIGDTDHDYEVAQALGINLILIARGHQSLERLQALHPETLPDLKAA
ncbi:HAD hydrolase-like protein [Sansalvadorimonas sp. 2012CJ34-2]|uniref:phosphoglycolate phosphatase n=1 Tax=Parendozoicomonas callyspongiae TaxID=2942213 RepID=A0ABT0PJQ0_9GAMM|nr:HAD hydrolase-like protein [Sansalvadorimonas sp. 2012CJ34-2]MCL6271625.1 HAD hydrolase-like protein [Sansalvadorimonas sp. 2012CJ34-2]